MAAGPLNRPYRMSFFSVVETFRGLSARPCASLLVFCPFRSQHSPSAGSLHGSFCLGRTQEKRVFLPLHVFHAFSAVHLSSALGAESLRPDSSHQVTVTDPFRFIAVVASYFPWSHLAGRRSFPSQCRRVRQSERFPVFHKIKSLCRLTLPPLF